MLKSLATYLVKNLVRKKELRQKKFLNWDEIKTIALVLENNEKSSKHQIDNWMGQFKKHCEVYYIELRSKTPSYADWHCFTKKDKNLLGLPGKKTLESLKTKKYDLLINTAERSLLFSTAISAALYSTCICSSSEAFAYGDLIIKRSENQDLIKFLEEVERYLKIINSKNKVYT